MVNSVQKTELYHFKVMELKSHEDTKDTTGFSSCKLRFHFFFHLLQKLDLQHLQNYDWDVNSTPQQRLYLSRDTQRLMEVINNFTATVYRRSNSIDDKKQVQQYFDRTQDQDDS